MSVLGSIFDRGSEPEENESKSAEANRINQIATELEEIMDDKSGGAPILVQKGAYFFLETVFYFLTLIGILAVIFYSRISPFDIFADMLSKSEVKNALGGVARIQDISFIVRVLIGTIALFSFIIARNLNGLRKQKTALSSTQKKLASLRKSLDN